MEEYDVVETTEEPVTEAYDWRDVIKKPTGVITNALKVNVRAEASAGAAVIEVLDALTEVAVDADTSSKDWCAVELADGRSGFVMRRYLAIRAE